MMTHRSCGGGADPTRRRRRRWNRHRHPSRPHRCCHHLPPTHANGSYGQTTPATSGLSSASSHQSSSPLPPMSSLRQLQLTTLTNYYVN